MNRQQKHFGFTLIELMITVAVIGILASIAMPSYLETVRKSRRADVYDLLLECAASQARQYTISSPHTYLDQSNAEALGVCGIDDGTNLTSKEGYYTLAITNSNCSSNGQFWCFSATATAVGSQANDTDCASFTVDHTGLKTASPDTLGNCWRS